MSLSRSRRTIGLEKHYFVPLLIVMFPIFMIWQVYFCIYGSWNISNQNSTYKVSYTIKKVLAIGTQIEVCLLLSTVLVSIVVDFILHSVSSLEFQIFCASSPALPRSSAKKNDDYVNKTTSFMKSKMHILLKLVQIVENS